MAETVINSNNFSGNGGGENGISSRRKQSKPSRVNSLVDRLADVNKSSFGNGTGVIMKNESVLDLSSPTTTTNCLNSSGDSTATTTDDQPSSGGIPPPPPSKSSKRTQDVPIQIPQTNNNGPDHINDFATALANIAANTGAANPFGNLLSNPAAMLNFLQSGGAEGLLSNGNLFIPQNNGGPLNPNLNFSNADHPPRQMQKRPSATNSNIANNLNNNNGNLNASQSPEFCDLCSKEFPNKYYMKKHLRDAHQMGLDTAPGREPGECDDHSDNTHQCAHCGTKFVTRDWLILHVNTRHTIPGSDLNQQQPPQQQAVMPQNYSIKTSPPSSSSSSNHSVTTKRGPRQPKSEAMPVPPVSLPNEDRIVTAASLNAQGLPVHFSLKELAIAASGGVVQKSEPTAQVPQNLTPNFNTTPAAEGMVEATPTYSEVTDVNRGPAPSPTERVQCEICQKWVCNKYFLKAHKFKIHGRMDDRLPPKWQRIAAEMVQQAEVGQNPDFRNTSLYKNNQNKSPALSKVRCDLCGRVYCNKYFLRTHRANKHGLDDLPEHLERVDDDEDEVVSISNLSTLNCGQDGEVFETPQVESPPLTKDEQERAKESLTPKSASGGGQWHGIIEDLPPPVDQQPRPPMPQQTSAFSPPKTQKVKKIAQAPSIQHNPQPPQLFNDTMSTPSIMPHELASLMLSGGLSSGFDLHGWLAKMASDRVLTQTLGHNPATLLQQNEMQQQHTRKRKITPEPMPHATVEATTVSIPREGTFAQQQQHIIEQTNAHKIESEKREKIVEKTQEDEEEIEVIVPLRAPRRTFKCIACNYKSFCKWVVLSHQNEFHDRGDFRKKWQTFHITPQDKDSVFKKTTTRMNISERVTEPQQVLFNIHPVSSGKRFKSARGN